MGENHEPGRKRFRWLRRVLAIGLIVVIVCLTWLYWPYLRAVHRLKTVIAETDAADPRWRIEHILADRKLIPDAENSALVVLAAEKLIDLQKTPTQTDDAETAFDEAMHRPAHRLNAVALANLNANFSGYEAALLQYRKLVDMPPGYFPFTYKPGPF